MHACMVLSHRAVYNIGARAGGERCLKPISHEHYLINIMFCNYYTRANLELTCAILSLPTKLVILRVCVAQS